MDPHQSITPFGGRSLKLAHVAAQLTARDREPEKVAHKWQLFRAICTAKGHLGVSERALSVLNALLTFHPETVLTGDGLVVFPSNEQLALRAHGMAASTLRRHLAVLVDSGLIVRRDSPNGKRYARKGRGGDIELAFGFDLAPLVARADEIEAMAEVVLAEERAMKLARERITICRRDIAKMIAMAVEEGIPATVEASTGGWPALHERFRDILGRLPRVPRFNELDAIAGQLSQFADEILNILENHIKVLKPSGNESQTERHKQNSNPNPLIDLEPSFPESQGTKSDANRRPLIGTERTYPLAMVLQACPDIVDYSSGGVGNWRDLVATAAIVRSMLGISPSAWEKARAVMGEVEAAIVIAAMLQRAEEIHSAGGYLRSLTQKAEIGEFSLGPVLMALLGRRKTVASGKISA